LIRLIVLAMVLLLGAPAARAQADRPAEATRAKANRHFKNGVALYEEGKYVEALAEFDTAYATAPHPNVLYNIAGCHRALSAYGEALAYYDRFLDAAPGKVRQSLIDAARAERAGVLGFVATVVVVTVPEGATVTVDGRSFGSTPLAAPLVLGAGEHVVVADLDGHDSARRTVAVSAGDSVRVELKFVVVTAAASADGGAVGAAESAGGIAAAVTVPASRARTFGVSAALATNARNVADTGAPVVGVDLALGARAEIGVDVMFVAFAAIPHVRYRLLGETLSVHAVAALPVAFNDGDQSETFAAVAGGIAIRYRASAAIAIRLETWLSYAGSERGTTLPTFAGAELWF